MTEICDSIWYCSFSGWIIASGCPALTYCPSSINSFITLPLTCGFKVADVFACNVAFVV